MKTALHTMGTPEYTALEALELAASLGFDGIEVIWDDDYYSAIRKDASAADLSELKSRATALNLSFACLTPYMTQLNSIDPGERRGSIEEFKRCIEVACEIDAEVIRVYGGGFFRAREAHVRKEKEELLIASLRELGDYAGRHGVTLAVETHFNTMTDTASETSRIIRRVNHEGVRVLYDQPNLDFYGAEDYQRALTLLAGMITHVHVKDFVFKNLADTGFVSSSVANIGKEERKIISRVPGTGNVAWPGILDGLRKQGYDGWLSFEYERRWYPDELPPADTGFRDGLIHISELLSRY